MARILPLLNEHADCLIDQESSYQFGQQEDLVLVLGGDGSILQAARQMNRQQRPVSA